MILDCDVDFEVLIILGRPFLAIDHALVNMEKGQMKFRLNSEKESFKICMSMKQSIDFKRYLLYLKGLRVFMRYKTKSVLVLRH